MDLRLTMLAVPPLLPLIHRDLPLTQTQVAVLTGLPVVLFSLAAVPASFLISWLGARATLVAGLALVAIASALRGAWLSVPVLFAMTFLMGVGIAVMQPALPTLVREWFPRRMGLATAIYTNGLLVGEVLGASLTLPLVLPWVGGSWPWSLALWAVPVVLTAFGFVTCTESAPAAAQRESTACWWPDWGNPLAWRLGLVFGSASVVYFGTNAFLPDFLSATGRAALTAAALSSINLGQIPASFLALAFSRRLEGRRFPFVALGTAASVALAGFVFMPGAWIVFWSGVLGFCSAFTLILTLALLPLLAAPGETHRLSAAVLSVSYAFSFLIPLLGGALWDATRIAALAFLPAGAAAVAILGLAATLPLKGRLHPEPVLAKEGGYSDP